jgi:hypothetical protein
LLVRRWGFERGGNFAASIFLSRVTEWGTRTMTTFAQPLPYDDFSISDELVGLLHRATEGGVLELVATLRANQRAILAIQCYGKSHLRRIGLTIASTCDLGALVRGCGPVRGEAIFAQSRTRPDEPMGRARAAVTLARSAGGPRPPQVDFDLVDLDDAHACEQAVPA